MTQTRLLTNLRFPLIVLVVLIHVYASLNSAIAIEGFIIIPLLKWISLVLARAAVPLFFVISGYFFFYGVEKFDKSCYFGKLKRRLYSLLIPYLAWNTIFLLLYAIKGADVGIRDYWDANSGEPICYPFWFIRDLMIVCIFTPVVYWLVKKIKYLAFILLLPVWFLNGGGIFESFTFFIAGATMSILHIDINIPQRHAAIIAVLSIVLSMIATYLNLSNHYILYTVVLVLMVGIYSIMSCLPRSFNMPQVLTNSTLYTLGLSTLIIMVLVTLLKKYAVISSLALFTSYIVIALCSVGISVIIYLLISRLPFSFILTGKTTIK